MTNEAKIRIEKRATKPEDAMKEMPINAAPPDKFLLVRNVFNSKAAVELQIGDLRIEVSAHELQTAIENAVRSSRY